MNRGDDLTSDCEGPGFLYVVVMEGMMRGGDSGNSEGRLMRLTDQTGER